MESTNINKNLAVYRFLETQFQVFKGYFIVTRAIQDEEAIHQMRVAIKRIRSIQKLKKHLNFPSLLNDEQYNDIKALFAISGQMRDLQVQQKLLRKFTKELEFEFVELKEYLIELEVTLGEQFHQSLLSFNLKQFEGVGNGSELPDFAEDNIDLEKESFVFLHKKLDKIHHLIQSMDQSEFVHDLRKQVKHLFFILHFFSSYFPERKIGAYDTIALKGVGEKLGNWNDREVFMRRVEEFVGSSEEKYLESHPEYSQLMEYLKEKKQEYLQGIDVDLSQELDNIKALLNNGFKETEKLTEDVINKVSSSQPGPPSPPVSGLASLTHGKNA